MNRRLVSPLLTILALAITMLAVAVLVPGSSHVANVGAQQQSSTSSPTSSSSTSTTTTTVLPPAPPPTVAPSPTPVFPGFSFAAGGGQQGAGPSDADQPEAESSPPTPPTCPNGATPSIGADGTVTCPSGAPDPGDLADQLLDSILGG